MNNKIIFGILLIIFLFIILACCGIKYKKKSSRKFCSNENFDIDNICRKYPLECPTGYYCPTGSSYPTICATGSYCQTPSTQIACFSGNYCPGGTVMPNPCEVGFYCPTPSSQISCPTGYFCPERSLTPTICPTGYYCPTGNSQPIFCNTISYCPQGSIFEQSCPTGYVCSASGYVGSQFFFIPVHIKTYWKNISISNDGKYQTAAQGSSNNNSGSIYVSSDYGKTWSQHVNINLDIVDVKMSISGQYQIAISPFHSWRNVSNPDTGIYKRYVIDSGMYNSSDYGETWSMVNFESEGYYNRNLQITSDGKYQVLIITGNNYNSYKIESNDYGVSWTETPLPFELNELFISSNDGTYQIATPRSNRGVPYVSSDKGQTWSTVLTNEDTSRFFSTACLSNTGQYQIISKGENIYLSSDYGKSWGQPINVYIQTSSTFISCISMSSSGQYVIAGTKMSEYLYGSTDYGRTWKKVNSIPAYWTSVSISGDGKYSSAVGSDTLINISKSTL